MILRAQESQWWIGAPGQAWLSRRCVLSLLPMPACSQDTPRGSHTLCAMASIMEMYGRGRDNSKKVLNRLLPYWQHQESLQSIAKRKQVPTNKSMFRKLPPVCYFVTVFRWTGHMETGQAILQCRLCSDLGYYLALPTSNIWFRSWSRTLPL